MDGEQSGLSALPHVSETVLKRRKTLREVKEARTKARNAQRSFRSGTKQEKFKYPETFVRAERHKQKDEIRLHRGKTRQRKSIKVPEGQKLAFVIRIRGASGMEQSVRKVLQHLRLHKSYTGCFIKLSKQSLELLRVVEPYVTWGYPDLKITRDLVMKRGHAMVDGRRMALSDNAFIEKQLGEAGIICMEDLIHEIFAVGRSFRSASQFLWPFKLTAPKEGFRRITKPFREKGDTGNRGEAINALLRQMI
eukprot:scpid53741/ scgid20987/ 60S ribosomal protein L7